MPTAIITGASGQDGSYLMELLLEKGYTVLAMIRRNSTSVLDRIQHLLTNPSVSLHYGDMTDMTSLMTIIKEASKQPSSSTSYIEIYNLAAQSHVKVSFETPIYTANADAVGVLNLLEAVRMLGMEKSVRIYQASTSEMFGAAPAPQNESTPFHPRSPYGVAKLYAHWILRNYREAYGMWTCAGLLFNHESPRRGYIFVTRKITRAVATYARDKANYKTIEFGNLDAIRDWGHARDYVEAMHMMLQRDEPKDYVIATGVQCTVRSFIEKAFAVIGVVVLWKDDGNEGYDAKTGTTLVKVNSKYYRPSEVDHLCGDASVAMQELDWKPRTSLEQLISEMVESDIACPTT
jgi:GDPmannose 4,6-dehydratase